MNPGSRRPGVPPRVAGALLTTVSLLGCGRDGAGPPPTLRPRGAVAAGTPEATRVGLQIMARGGNAADAAVATSLAEAVTQPGHAGLGGWGVAVLRVPGREPVVLDVDPPPAGPDSVPSPTLVALLEELWRRHGSGTLAWADLVGPAERLARDGYDLGRFGHRTLVREYDRLERDSAAAALVLMENRAIPPEHSRVSNPELATTLEHLARTGPDDFYGGDIARRIDRAFRSRGGAAGAPGIPTARETAALSGSFGGWKVWAPPHPYGGPELLRALELLEGAPSGMLVPGARGRTAWIAEALAYAFGPDTSVAAHLARVPDLPGAPMPATVGPGRDGPVPVPGSDRGNRGKPPTGGPAEAGTSETSHLSVVDGNGMAVALTQTLGRPYGAGWPVDALGFFAARAERPAVVTGGTDTVAPPPVRVVDREWLAPTLVTRDDTAVAALGSPGGLPGVGALVQVLATWLSGADSLEHAVSTPRIHVGMDAERRGRLYLEGVVSDPSDTIRLLHVPETWGDTVRALAAARGFRFGERDTGLLDEGREPWFGGVNAVARTGGRWRGVADPRRDGGAGSLVRGAVPLLGALSPSAGGGSPQRPPGV